MAPNQRYLQYDSLHDRREIYRLLDRLPPAQRLAWLRWVCTQAKFPGTALHPRPGREMIVLAEQACRDSSASDRLTLKLYFDVWHLGVSFDLDFDRIVRKLVAMVRGQ